MIWASGDNFEFGSGRILIYSSYTKIAYFEIKVMISEQISAKKACRMGISTSWNEMRN